MARKSKKNRKERFKDTISTDLRDKVKELMRNRHKLLAPFPLDWEELYRSLWTQREWDAMQELMTTGLLVQYAQLYIPVPPRVFDRNIVITVKLPAAVPMSSQRDRIPFMSLSAEQQRQVMDWIPVWRQYGLETKQVAAAVERIAKVCTSYGQAYRIWPQLKGFMDEHAQECIDAAKMRVPYPKEACEEWVDNNWNNRRRVKEEFMPEAFAPFNLMIAECLMLPEIECNHSATHDWTE